MRPSLDMLLRGLTSEPCAALPELAVAGLAIDSRLVVPGDVFFARDGASAVGLDYALDAVRAGAVAVVARAASMLDRSDVVETLTHGESAVPVIGVGDVDEALGVAADRFYDAPSASLRVAAVTGTNGKTTVAWLAAQALAQQSKAPVGLLGTIGTGTLDKLQPAALTTADAIAVQRNLAAIRDAGAQVAVMEASSHALAQRRLAGTRLAAAAFSNLSRDHLDYHGSFDAYLAAKQRLFFDCAPAAGVFNIDDPAGASLATAFASGRRTFTCSLGAPASTTHGKCRAHGAVAIVGELRSNTAEGLELAVKIDPSAQAVLIRSPLLGEFNAANLLLAFGLLLALDVAPADAASALSNVAAPPGRMQRCGGDGAPTVVIDFAHTPDALGKALDALRALAAGQLYCVFGCGGDRDRGKRPLMAQAAAARADVITLTDDNPRSEDGDRIVADALAGLDRAVNVLVERDRARAIRGAIAAAGAGDVVLIAGKGHEDYQEIAGKRHPFLDLQVARDALANLHKASACGGRR